jgi:ribosome modulation factor
MSDTPKAGDNNALNAVERQALLLHHKKIYERRLAAKKAADAELRNACKLATSELGEHAVDEIKDAIKLEQPGGEAELRGEVERKLGVAQTMNAALGFQYNFTEDMRPATDRAFAEGRKAGLEGMACTPPHNPAVPQYDSWIEGWHEGQAVLASDFRAKVKAAPAAADDDPEFAEVDGAEQLDLVDAVEGSRASVDTSNVPFNPPLDEPAVVTDPDAMQQR